MGYHFQVNGGVSCATLRAQCEPLENPAGVIFDLDPQNQGATRIHKLRGREPGKRTTNGQETGTREDMLRGVVVAGRGKLKNTYKVACIAEKASRCDVVAGRGKLKNTYKVACITKRLQDVTSGWARKVEKHVQSSVYQCCRGWARKVEKHVGVQI